MKASTERQRAVGKALTTLIPLAPYADSEPIRQAALARDMRELPPSIAVWLATVAHVRHVHTEYDSLLDEGYDRESARHFVIDAINATLTRWRATRFVSDEDNE
jgi:hypothetical protein